MSSGTRSNQNLRRKCRKCDECKCLGVVISDDLFFYKLHCVSQKVLIHLFKVHAIFYDVEKFFMKLYTKESNIVSIAYHKATKCMCNKRVYDSYYECLERISPTIFKHLVDKRVINFAFSIFQSKSPSLSSHKYNVRVYSNYGKEIKKKYKKNNKFLTCFSTHFLL